MTRGIQRNLAKKVTLNSVELFLRMLARTSGLTQRSVVKETHQLDGGGRLRGHTEGGGLGVVLRRDISFVCRPALLRGERYSRITCGI